MPAKARRVASRQAQLNRRKRQQRGPSGIPAVEAKTAIGDQQPTKDTISQTNGVANPVHSTETAPAAALTATARSPRPMGPGRLQRGNAASANYVGSELRRILIMAGAVLAIIIVLGITV